MDVQTKLEDREYIDFNEKYLLIPYSRNNFLESISYSKALLSGEKFYPKHFIEKSPLYNYLTDFFEYSCFSDNQIKYEAKLIVIESDFISESYVSDIKHFYADCFNDYTKNCKRIHFFNEFYTVDDFRDLILEDKLEGEINESYLGNITVKPTGNSIIGPTFLKPYPYIKDKRLRFFNSLIELNFNLFGKRMPLEGLVFQEQDQTIGLCATQAIWSSTQALTKIFRTNVIYPADISIKAGFNDSSGRIFPNNGFTNQQIYTIYSSLGLACDVISSATEPLFNNKLLKRIIYAYNKLGIPILLGYKRKGSESKNRHIVTVLGYRIDETLDYSKGDSKSIVIPTFSDWIKRIYCHDDQLGPYAKIGILDNTSREIQINFEKETPKFDDASITSLIIPLKKSIRIKFEHIEQSVASFDFLHYIFVGEDGYRYKDFEWDIYLEKGTTYKHDIIENKKNIDCKEDTIYKIAFSSFPKYIWVARLYSYDKSKNKNYLYDIIYDASESPSLNNFCIHKMFFFDEVYGKSILNLMKDNKDQFIKLFDSNDKVRFSELHITTFEEMLES